MNLVIITMEKVISYKINKQEEKTIMKIIKMTTKWIMTQKQKPKDVSLSYFLIKIESYIHILICFMI